MNVIMAAGDSTRWGEYLGAPKQMVPIDGEPLLHRTIRQVTERSGATTVVTVPHVGYFGDLRAIQHAGANDCLMDMFTNAPCTPPTLYFCGDVYFTDDAMDTIFAESTAPMFYGRAQGNGIKEYGELFAVRLDAASLQTAWDLRAVHATLPRCGGWELYRAICGYPLDVHLVGEHFTEINDDTDDFDYPHDIDKWMARRAT